MTERAPELASTYELIERSFPDGIEPWAYLPLLAILYEHLSDRNLAQVVADLSGRPWPEVLNDVYRVGSGAGAPRRDEVLARLKEQGYDAWTDLD